MKQNKLIYQFAGLLVACLLSVLPSFSQEHPVVQQLVDAGYTNVRYAERGENIIVTLENDRYKLQSQGIKVATKLLENAGMDSLKIWNVIVTYYNVPQVRIVKEPDGWWWATADFQEYWDQVKDTPKSNSSLFNVDLKIYPQLSFMNMIVNQIYQWVFDLSPTLEVSFWPGMKLSAMLKIPVYNDGYGVLEDKVHPGPITLSQRFRLMDRLQGRVVLGYFSNDRYGVEGRLKYQFPDPRFSVEGRLGYVGIGYWNGFHLNYDKDMMFAYTLQGNFFWPRYNTQFSLKAMKWLLKDYGVKIEMIRHFRYCSVGFYAMKATDSGADMNGGFRVQVAIPPYNLKRYKHFPRITTSGQMGLVYNAGNERYYYKEYKAESSDNVMEENQFNPAFLQNELDRND